MAASAGGWLVVIPSEGPPGSGARVALPLETIVEVLAPAPLTPLPGAPPFVLGAIGVRGQPVPLLDLALLVEPVEPPTRRTSYASRPLLLVDGGAGAGPIALATARIVGLERESPTDATLLDPVVLARRALDALRSAGASARIGGSSR